MNSSATDKSGAEDPWLWLEDVQGERALAWVHERNAHTERLLQALPGFEQRRRAILDVLDSRERIPAVTRLGPWLYNLWQDENNRRGLWRRATFDEFRQATPRWETVLDLDALGRSEGENWVFAGAECLGPAYRRCLLSLSRGGADAHVVREFDLVDKRFVDDGFRLPEAKTSITWIDADRVFVGSDFGPGSLTASGYPRTVRLWRRGEPVAQARTVYEGRHSDVSVHAWVDRTPGFERTLFGRYTSLFDSHLVLAEGDAFEHQVPIDKPADASLAWWRDKLLLQLRSDCTLGAATYTRGSLLLSDAGAYLRGERRFTVLFEPSATRSLAGCALTRSALILSVLEDVNSRLEEWRPVAGNSSGAGSGEAQAAWQRRELPAPAFGSLSVAALHDPLLADDALAEHYWLRSAGFLQPDALALAWTGGTGRGTHDDEIDARQILKSLPAFFDATGMQVGQHFARSKDGTRVPYFVVSPRGQRTDGGNPTLLYGYGGFEIALTPSYLAIAGGAWLARGGVYVLANIRGGEEYGPAWHQAALRERKQASYDDFAAVAEDLIARGITQPRHLGIQGGSNGGLMVAAVMLQRPELFGAVVCQVPLLDMRRYHRLLAGASWMSEYGDPDKPEDWAFISRYSPYQNVRRGQAGGVRLPPVLFTTSTRDDRVHPGHARKMAARLAEYGHEALYWENTEGGHGGAADNAQRATMRALEFAFLWQRLAP